MRWTFGASLFSAAAAFSIAGFAVVLLAAARHEEQEVISAVTLTSSTSSSEVTHELSSGPDPVPWKVPGSADVPISRGAAVSTSSITPTAEQRASVAPVVIELQTASLASVAPPPPPAAPITIVVQVPPEDAASPALTTSAPPPVQAPATRAPVPAGQSTSAPAGVPTDSVPSEPYYP